MKFIFCIIAFLIVYGSLYPFDIFAGPVSESGLQELFNFNINKAGFIDLIANIILFIPFGIFIKAAFPSKRPTFSFIKFMLIGFVFAFLIQVLQLWTTNRFPWGGDAVWNAVGCAIGLIFHSLISSLRLKYRQQSTAELRADSELGHSSNYLQAKGFDIRTSDKALTPLNSISFSHVKTITKHPYIGGLDGLRAVAALAVFFVHFQQFSGASGSLGYIDFERLMTNGDTGVGLFFVLSGFLLSVPFWREISVGTFPKMRDYMINRAVRIMPIYYCCLFGILVLNGFQSSDINFNNIISHVFFVHNLKDHQVMTLNPPFWTLAVEFQFYLLLPFLFLLLAKVGIKRAQVLCVLLVPTIYISYRMFMQYLEGYQNWPIQIPLIWPFGVSFESAKGLGLTYSLMAHLPHFLIGIIAASFFKNLTTPTKRQAYLAELVFWLSAVSVFFILATPLDDQLQLAYGRYNFPFIPILLGLIVFSTPYTQFAKSLLEWAPIKWLGIISYGLYIFHWPIQQASVQALEALGLRASDHLYLFAGLSFVITVTFSHFSYLLIEAPILKRFKKHKKTNERMDPSI